MNEIYVYEGQEFEVAPHRLQEFLEQYPGATKVEEPGKTTDSPAETQAASQDVTGSQSEDGSLVLPEDRGFIEDIVQVYRQSKATGGTVNDAFNIYKLGKDISEEQLQSVIEARQKMQSFGPTNEQASFAKDQKANGGGIVGTLLALKDNPGFIPQFLVGSAVTMASSLQSEEVAGTTAAAAGVGAAGGAAAGSTGFTFGPLGAATTAAGAVTGTFSGAIGGLVGSMETGLTLMDLIQEEVGEGVKLTKENIRAVIDDAEKFEKIKQRAAARGRNIGAVESMTLGISKGVGGQLTRAGKFRRAAATTTAIESGGGFIGEVAGQIGAEQDIDLGEATLEAIGEVAGPGQAVNLSEIVRGTLQKSEYNINGEKRSKKEILDLIESDKLTNEEKTKIKFDIKNDQQFNQLVNQKLNDISLETQIDAKVEDTADRKKLVDLEKQRVKAEADTKKKGIFTVPGAETKLENIEEQINEIVGKYTAIDGRTADVRARKKTAQQVRENIADKNFEANLDFAKKHSKLYGLEVEDNLTQEQIKEKYGDDLANSLGGIVDNKLVINKKLAKTRVYGDNVANHELLHGIIKASGQKIKQSTIDDFLNIIGEENKAKIQDRIDKNYTPEYMADNLDEYFTIFSDAIANNEIKFNDSIFTKVKDGIRRTFADLGYTKVDFETGRGAYNFLKDYNKSIHKGALASGVIKATKGEGRVETPKFSKAPETLIKTIKRGVNPKKVKAAEDALVPQYQALAIEALGYTEKKGDIRRENVISAVNEYYEAIVRNYDPKKGAFSTHVYNNIAPKNDTIFEKAKTLAIREGVKLDDPEVRELAGDAGTTTNVEDTFVQKINILKDFAITNRVADKIKSLVKVAEGDTFKQVISKHAGKVGELIFDIPAKKIMDGEANLIPTTKYKDGMPIPAEAQNIQRFFQAGENMSKFIKSLPTYNVAKKTADIDKIGENIETPRNVFGVAIGLKGLPLNYFYENYTDPKAFSKDPDVYEQRITSKGGRSRGVSTQTQVKKLKPEFINPTPEVIEKAKRDIGITPKNEPNIYNRNIGQLQKGFAKVYSINASLSSGQRFLADKLTKAPTEKKPAIKKQIAGVTAAQGKAAFSKSKTEKIVDINVSPNFEGDVKNVNSLLKDFIKKGKYKFDNEASVNQFYEDVENVLIKSLPEGYITKRILRPSGRVLGANRNKQIVVNGKKMTIDSYYTEKRNKLLSRKDLVYGKPFTGKAKNFTPKKYKDVFGNSAKSFEKANRDGTIKEFNEVNASMHRQLWQRINESIAENKDNARIWGSYFSTVSLITEHPHRLGAEFVGWSPRPKGFDGKLYEWEHAMPASQSYLYLLESILDPNFDFDLSYQLVMDNYKLVALDNFVDKTSIKQAGRTTSMGKGWSMLDGSWLDRYFKGDIDIDARTIVGLDGRTFEEIYSIPRLKKNINKNKTLNKSIAFSRSANNESKGITVLDFDDTLATTKSLVKYTTPDGKTGTLNAEEFASTYEDLQDQGYTFDFSDFNKVVKGKLAPLFNKAIKLQGKFGPENMFVLTARPPAAQKAIFDFLKANGLNIPLKNITGLGNSTSEAKALWIADKVGEGYNDFYFADDALQNVQAVKNMLDQFDVKSKVQQAKVKFSKSMDNRFNDILEEVTGIDSKKRFSDIKARKRGASKGKFRFFIPPSHEDFVGLLYNFMGKGKKGNAHRDFFEQALIRPLNRAYRELNTAKQSIANDYKSLNKQFPNVKKKLNKKTPDGDFTFEDAIRVYLFDKHGHDITGLSETDQKNLVDIVMKDPELRSYAETLNTISKQEAYVSPTESWDAGNIRTDLDDATGRIGREEFFTEFFENTDVIFSPKNMNKIEAAYGAGMVSALKDILYRTKTGRNRPSGQNKMVNQFMNYLNGSVGATMFFNIRSSVLQQMSLVNFINFADNNVLAASKAFANQKQYWKDWAMLFNSDFMKQRRGGIKTDVNGAELAASVKDAKNPAQAVIKKLLEVGFLPTQIGDNIAIATGGSSFYRNRINTYLKQGLSKKDAESKAFVDFQVLAEATQQSARPDMVSQQQASPLGKIILAFQNVTSQFNRLGKKAFLDLKNRRISPEYKNASNPQFQSDIGNISRIAYYFAIQNLIFYALQSALFSAMFDDDEDDERFLKKKERMINGSIDSVLRGTGVWGAAVSTLKNMAIKWHEQREKGYNADESAVLMEMLNVSPPLGIKARKLVNAEKTLNYNTKVIKEMETFDIDNPQWSAVTNYVEATTNVPLNRLYNKTINVRDALDSQHSAMERALMFAGWSKWNLGIPNEKIEKIKKKQKFGTKKKPTKKQLEFDEQIKMLYQSNK